MCTGGSSGIGFATAQRFAAEGAHVFITGRRASELDEAVKQIGKNVTGVQGDMSRRADLDWLYAVVKEKRGHIDVLFANAGVFEIAPLGAITEEHYDRIFDINVKGVLFTVQKALPLFQDGGSNIDRCHQGFAGVERLQRHQGRCAILRPRLDHRLEGPQNSCERN